MCCVVLCCVVLCCVVCCVVLCVCVCRDDAPQPGRDEVAELAMENARAAAPAAAPAGAAAAAVAIGDDDDDVLLAVASAPLRCVERSVRCVCGASARRALVVSVGPRLTYCARYVSTTTTAAAAAAADRRAVGQRVGEENTFWRRRRPAHKRAARSTHAAAAICARCARASRVRACAPLTFVVGDRQLSLLLLRVLWTLAALLALLQRARNVPLVMLHVVQVRAAAAARRRR